MSVQCPEAVRRASPTTHHRAPLAQAGRTREMHRSAATQRRRGPNGGRCSAKRGHRREHATHERENRRPRRRHAVDEKCAARVDASHRTGRTNERADRKVLQG